MTQLRPGGFISATYNALSQGSVSTVEYLVVAGGAGGQGARFGSAAYRGGIGGGAGGLRTSTAYNITPGTSITVTVGAGGTGAPASNCWGGFGGNSVFGTVTSLAGSPAGYYDTHGVSTVGGSGAGGSQISGVCQAGGAGTTGQGYAGGTGSSDGYAGGGGGGAGSVGGAGVSGQYGGSGGAGLVSTITGTRQFYAGGGGGNIYSTGNAGLGMNGAGCGVNSGPGISAQSNTGSGGGAGGSGGGNGGSGIVIIRYPAALNTPTSVTNAQISYAYGYQIYTWTQSGSITF